nr:hypothetical protein [Bacillus cereus]
MLQLLLMNLMYFTQQVIDVINKSRGAGFEALLAFQSFSGYRDSE